MTVGAAACVRETQLRSRCAGIVPLQARLESWQVDVCSRPGRLDALLREYGSPLNVLHVSAMEANAAELRRAADGFGLELGVYFARKANKALALVDEAHRLGLGVDLASEPELSQVLVRGIPGETLVMTAAVKPAPLLARCVAAGATIVIDNRDELMQLRGLVGPDACPVPIALRLAPRLPAGRVPTRFGFDRNEMLAVVDEVAPTFHELSITGVHFHLDGYRASDRAAAVSQALDVVRALRARGHRPAFIDIGGGIPISYLESAAAWDTFWAEHRGALLGQREPLTFEGHGLGLIAHRDEIVGTTTVYPFHQTPTGGDWLAQVLTSPVRSGYSVADAIRAADLQLRCEPGRALLDGCGLTAARVAYRKQRHDGTWLIGVEMNRTQCRSTSDDFLVDPLLIAHDTADRPRESTGPIEGYLVGAYCIERELLTWRRMRFPTGVAIGDIVVFPNTAGYLMHILESSSHQMPLARNLIVSDDGQAFVDPIDA